MSNNAPDYNENLAFKPAMTWEELCEYAKSKGAYISDEYFYFDYMEFTPDGDITLKDGDTTYFIGRERTYEQMKNIIDNLYGE